MFNYDPSKHPTTEAAERSAIPKALLWEDQAAPPQRAYGIGAPRTRTSQNCHALPQRGLDRKGKWLFAGHQHVRQQLCIRAGEKGEISSSPNSYCVWRSLLAAVLQLIHLPGVHCCPQTIYSAISEERDHKSMTFFNAFCLPLPALTSPFCNKKVIYRTWRAFSLLLFHVSKCTQ